MKKIASENVLAVLKTAGPTLRKLAAENKRLSDENSRLASEVNEFKMAGRVEKLAAEALEKELGIGHSIDEARSFFKKKAAAGEIQDWERAVKLSAQRFDLGQPGSPRSGGGSQLEKFLLEDE